MFVIGGRKDTHESIEQLRLYSVDLAPDIAIYTALTPFPGTVYYETAKKNGWIQDTNYTNYDMAHAIMPTETLNTKGSPGGALALLSDVLWITDKRHPRGA